MQTAIVAPTLDPRVNGLLSGVRWADLVISYSDPDSVTDYLPFYQAGPFENFSPLEADQISVVHTILDAIEGFTNLTFNYLGSGSGAGTLLFSSNSTIATAFAFYPSVGDSGGDSYYGPATINPVTGNYANYTFLHEIGHALGLKHGHETHTYGALPFDTDSMEYSVETYKSFVGSDAKFVYNEEFGYAQTYMMYDIAALQYMYGADFTTNSGNTTYRWNPLTGESFVNGALASAPGGNRVFSTIWDGGGNDTYDLSNYATDLKLDLTPGEYSTFSTDQLAYLGGGPNGGFARGNVANALRYGTDNRSLIENAIGGTGDDMITGNGIANSLVGNGGKDTLRGQAGADILRGGAQADILFGGTGNDSFDFNFTVHSFGGARDTIRDFQGAGVTVGDRIDLFDIDANAVARGNQAFAFDAAPGIIGRLWAVNVGANTHIRGSTDADAPFEFEIAITDGAVMALDYSSADFFA